MVRLANLGDLDVIYSFICELEECEIELEKFTRAYHLNLFNIDNIYLVAEYEDEVIGFLSCHTQLLLHHGGETIGEIQEMYVDINHRNLGVGKLLLDELKVIALTKNIIQIEVTSNNLRESTHRFYIRENFKETHKKFVFKKY